MFNQVFLVGRLATMPDLTKDTNEDYETKIMLNVSKPYDAYDNRYNYVKVPILVWRGMAKKLVSCAQVGSYVAVKGRLCNCFDDENKIMIEGESVQVLDDQFAHFQE